MKKTYFKKALSLIMAVMMIMSCWVWVAPQKAEAAAGTYYVRIYYKITDYGDDDDWLGDPVAYTGPTMTDISAGLTLYHKGNNGTASNATAINKDMVSIIFPTGKDGQDNVNVTGSVAFSGVGFPTSLQFYCKAGSTDYAEWYITKITVAASSSATEHTLWTGEVGCAYGGNAWQGEISTSGFTSHRKGSGTWTQTSDTSKWIYPYANTSTVVWNPTSLVAMTCPKTASDASETQKVSVTVKDQYGVQMFDPTWSISGDIKTTGLSVNPTTSSGSTTINVTSSANILNTTNTQTATIKATWSTPNSTGNTSKSATITCTINDATYDATFTGHRDAEGVIQGDYITQAQYGVPPTPPTAYDYSEGDYDYTFTGWNPSVETGISADTTYTAQYSKSDFIVADYTAVNEAIAAAEAIKAQYGTEYEFKFTYATRTALDAAINAVVTGLGRTQQTTVDGYAAAINAAIAALEPNKFDVIFLDKFGAILLYDKNAEYKSSVTPPEFPEDQKTYYDADNHYTYAGWDSDEYTSILDDLVIAPVYTAEAHDWKIETVTSTCVQAGTQKYTCNVCGYVKYDGGDQLGDHVWNSEFTVDLEPTCTLPGSKSIHCTLCDARKDETEIEPKGHLFSTVSSLAPATCDRDGIDTRLCDECGVCEHVLVPASGHNYVKTTVAPTCTAKGYDEYVCQNDGCGFSYRDNYTDVIAHSYGEWETVSEAHCGIAGVKKQTCTECGYINLDSIDALTHNTPDTWTVVLNPTCEGKGYQVKNCTRCGLLMEKEEIAALTHDYKVTSETSATCITAGVKTETCANCGDVNKTVTQAAGHNYDAGVTSQADCTHGGFKVYTCQTANCGHVKYEILNGAEALGHNFENGTEVITVEPTCETEGQKTIQCVNAGCEYKTTQVISKLGHDMQPGTAVPATCTTSGYTPYTCNNTGCTYTFNVYDADATGHSFDETIEENVTTVDATCVADGSKTVKCKDCNAENITVLPKLGHKYEKQSETSATCTAPATETYKCANCSDTYIKYVAASLAHDWSGEWTVVKAATDEETGLRIIKCKNCDAEKSEIIPTIGAHEYTVSIKTPATCTTAGEKVYTCTKHNNCSYTEVIPATGHKEKLVYIAPTCTSEGSNKIACDTCKADLTEAVVLPMLAHTYGTGTVTTPATCSANGVKTYTCTACQGAQITETIPATGHSLSTVYTPATCEAKGSLVTSCGNCNYSTTQDIPAMGHNLTVTVKDATCSQAGSVTEKCSRCDYEKVTEIAIKNHLYNGTVTITKAATCTENGEKTVKCNYCDVVTTVVIPMTGHTWGEYTTTEKATCTEDGKKVAGCTNEDCTAEDEIILPKLGHSYGEWEVVSEATNDTDGKWKRTCANCDDVEEITIPKGGHKFDNAPEITKEATCKETGTEVYKCSEHANCGVTLTVTIPVKQHTVTTVEVPATCTTPGSITVKCNACDTQFGEPATLPVIAHTYVAQPAVAATCTTSGYTTYICSCGDSYNEYDENAKALGHSLVEGTSTATCTGEGEMTLTCSRCNNYSTKVKVPALGHNYVENTAAATDATCAAAATNTYECSRCTASYTISVGEKTEEHTWDDANWVVKQSATDSSIGYKTNACTVCGQLKVETIDATGEHSFLNGEVVNSQLATCTTAGYEERKCTTHNDCGMTSRVILPALGHNENIVYTPATCENEGSTKIVCAACDAERDKKTIPALGHLYGEGEVTPSTCKDKGSIVYECTRTDCDGTHTVELELNANAHQYATTVTEATCTQAGSVVTKCTLCGNTTTNKELAAKGHYFAGEETQTSAPTCTADGTKNVKCKFCDVTTEVAVPKLGHDFGEWVKKDATNDEDGYWQRSCKRDGCTEKETLTIPKGGHNLVVSSKTDASCTSTGSVTYDCEAHTGSADCGIELTITLEKTQHNFTTTVKDATCLKAGEVVTACACGETYTTVIPATGHTYDEGVKTDASCTEEGKIVYTCTNENCGDTRTVVLEKKQHNYVAGTPVAPTCTASGYTPYKCATCDSSYVIVTAPANGHSYTENIGSTATCLTAGTTTLKCACGATMETNVPALGHDYQLSSTTTATCAAAATETYKCSRCEANYTVSVGSKTTEHDWNDWVVVEQPTYTSIGYQTRTCKICGNLEVKTINATGGHNLVEVNRDEPTCETDGKIYLKCDVHTDCGITDEVVIPKLGHSEELQYLAATCKAAGYSKIYCSTCDKVLEEKSIDKLTHVWGNEKITLSDCKTAGKVEFTCTYGCGETHTVELPINEAAHTISTSVTPATCKAAGSSVTVCTKCNKELVKTELPMLQHVWGEWTVTTPATNSEEGVMTRTCDNGCTETVNFPAGGHAFGSEPDSITAATCTTEGSATYKCTAHANCGVEITVKLAVVQHTITTEKEDATCTKEGFIKSYCSVCDKEYVNVTTGKLAHIFEVIDEVAPDCDTSGYKVYKCKNCTETYNEITDDALAHNYVEIAGSSTATCTTPGTKTLKCDKCDKEITVNVPALGHTWGEGKVTKAPTCEEKGVITFTCTVCPGTMTQELPTISHKYKTETTKATCTNDGSVVTVCEYCGERTTTVLPKLGHTWSDTPTSKVDAKCESEGSATYKCINEGCKETNTVIIPALGHVYEAGEKVAPTCTTSGYTVYVCKNDANHTYNVYDASQPAKGHSFGDWVVIEKATETKDGLKEKVCACGKKETEVIPAMMHNMVEVTTEYLAPTCTAEGHRVYKCDTKHDGVACTYTLTVDLPMIAHTLDTQITNASCTDTGKVVTICTECDTVNIETEIPALGHAWNEGQITTEATCTSEGEITFTCQHDAGHTYTKAIEKKQHEFEAGEEVAATCTENGYIPYSCKTCDESYVIITAEAKGHDYLIGESTATCEAAGTITITCKNADCKEVIVIDVAALGHNWGTGTVTKQPTCSAEGAIEYTCLRCGAQKTDKLDKVDHDYVVTTTDAECEEDGSVVTTCKHCDYKKTEIIKAKGHTWADTPASKVDAKCETEGSATYKCTNENCNETNTVKIPALGHIYEAKEAVAPTCTTSGYTVYVCKNDASHTYKVYDAAKPAVPHSFSDWTVVTNATQDTDGLERRECACGAVEEKVIPAMKHNMVVVSTKAATCTAEGETVYECKTEHNGVICNYTLTVVTSKIAHTLKTTVTPATCEAAGSVVTTCANEGCTAVNETTVLPALGHNYESVVTKDATCTEEGVMTYTCQNNAEHTYTQAIPAKGHSYTPVVTAPTCEAAGYTTYTCACGDNYTADSVPALGHNFGSWTDTGSEDVHTRYCSRCSETETEAHRWDNGKVIVEPSYDTEGQVLYTCGICGATKIVGVGANVDENAPTGEIKWNATLWNDFLSVITFGTYVNYDVVLEITAEDAETGIKSIEYYISDEALTLDEVKSLTAWTAYDSENKLTVPVVDASKFVAYAKLTDNKGNVTYLSTDGIVFDTTAPVLSIKANKGNAQTNVYCTNVTVEIEDANISYAIYDGKTVALTTDKFFCNEAGTHTVTVFDKAGNSTEITFTINDGHTWTNAPLADNSNLKSAATCDDKAVYYAACPVCGEIDNSTTFEYGDALGHNYVGTVTTPATCEKDGVKTYICQNDAEHTYTEAIPAPGHTAKAAVEENTVAAKCEQDGSYDMVVYCGVCGEELSRNSYVIPATGHNYEGTVEKAPTCTEKGVMTYVCKNDATHAYSEAIPALGHTDEDYNCICDVCDEKCCKETDLYLDRDAAIEPTCTVNGKAVLRCKNCNREEVTILPALGHNEVVTYVDATCSEFAHKIITCSSCDEYYEKIYTDNAYVKHSVVVIPGKPATCVTDGYTSYERCVNCGMVTEAKALYKEDVPHVDEDGNGKCDVCDGQFFTDTQTCNCLCHGTGIKGFLYKIALFFWKIFKMNKLCACGNVHY